MSLGLTTARAAAWLAASLHHVWLVPVLMLARLVILSAVVVVLVLSAEKGQRVEAIKNLPPVIDGLRGQWPAIGHHCGGP